MKKLILIFLGVVILTACSPNAANAPYNDKEVLDSETFMSYVNDSTKGDEKGKSVSFGGRVFNNVEEKDGKKYYQVYTDPADYEGIVMLEVPAAVEIPKLTMESYIKVEGVIIGRAKGRNVMGGEVVNLAIRVETLELSDYMEVVAPTLKTITVNQTLSQNGFSVSIDKIEFSPEDTRVYVKHKNETNTKVTAYEFNYKLVVGSKNYDIDSNYEANYPKIDTELAPGTETEGILTFKAIDPEKIDGLRITLERPYSNNYSLKFNDYEFIVSE